MSLPAPPSPAPDATVFRFGMRQLRTGLPGSVFLLSLGMLPLVIGTVQGGQRTGSWILGGVWLLLLGGLALQIARTLWVGRSARLVLEAYGAWWWHSREQYAVIPWASLAGVGVYWASKGDTKNGRKIMSLELCPFDDVPPSDPLLASLMVPAEALRRGLPEHRYRLTIPMPASRRDLAAAAQARAPHLWFGEHERPYDYLRRLRHVG
ncbi:MULTISPECIES: hypothetical protein [unclassified Streptomyces]|uniref:hypothetical protein n=1 Tax=unclassified Streptomyces TaxID=2593676 RepID=UPI00364E145D